MPPPPPMDRKSFGRATGGSAADRYSISFPASTGPIGIEGKTSYKEIAMSGNHRSSAFSYICAIVAVLASSENCLGAQYKLAPGDTVEVSVGGMPEQRNRVQIQID